MEEKEGQIDTTEAARALAAKRRIVSGFCEICGTAFTGTKKKKYCSSRCAMRAVRAGLSKPYAVKEEGETDEQ